MTFTHSHLQPLHSYMLLELPFHIETFERLLSTQDEIRKRLERGENVHGLVIRALEQTAGRGQRARDWISNKGGSYQTLAVKDLAVPVWNKPFATIAVAIGLAQVMPDYGIQVDIKWPNDIYYQNRKLAGILCEYTQGHLLIGIGVNVNNQVPEHAIGLQTLELEDVSDFVLTGLQRGLELLADNPDLPTLFAPYDGLENKTISVKVGNEMKEGIARGIDKNGCLRLEQEQGMISICSGHITAK
jgi:BirA family transcriptional regulator, biotin operon repressor / biotin---[acetyl-CoA-carboxylase] ligase